MNSLGGQACRDGDGDRRQMLTRPPADPVVEMGGFASAIDIDPWVEMAGFFSETAPDLAVEMAGFTAWTYTATGDGGGKVSDGAPESPSLDSSAGARGSDARLFL